MAEEYPALARAAQARHAAALARSAEAIRRLDSDGADISFVSVARAAGVARSWLYRQAELRTQIEKLRAVPARRRRVPAAQRVTGESLSRQVEALKLEASRLRDENRALRDQLARRLGSDRQSAVGGGHLR